MSQIVAQIREELKANTDPKTKEDAKRYFKETITNYGVKNSTLNKISYKHWQKTKNLPKKDLFTLCEELFSSGIIEEAFIATDWLPKIVDQFQQEDLDIFEHWINCYIDNWANVTLFAITPWAIL